MTTNTRKPGSGSAMQCGHPNGDDMRTPCICPEWCYCFRLDGPCYHHKPPSTALDLQNQLAEARAEIARLRSPAEVWRSYHALGDRVLGPWHRDGAEMCRKDISGRRECFVRPLDMVREGLFAGFLPERYQFNDAKSEPEAMRRIDSLARERGYVLIDGEDGTP